MQDHVDELERFLRDYLDPRCRAAIRAAVHADDEQALVDALLPVVIVMIGDEHSHLARKWAARQARTEVADVVHEYSGDELAQLAAAMRSTRHG
jgi:hypothetical protein